MRTWLNGRVPERHSGGVGSTPAVRTNSRASTRSRASSSIIAWEADLVTAPRRKRGEVGSKPTPGTNLRGQHKGADDPCKIVAVGALPTVSTKSFPSSHLGEGGRLLTGEGRFETCGGSHFAAVV